MRVRSSIAIGAVCAVLAVGCAGARPPASAPQRGAVGPRTVASFESGVRHVVQPGQTLWRIAHTYGVPLDRLADANGIAEPERLDAGHVLWIPGATRPLDVPLSFGPSAPERPPEFGWPVRDAEILSRYGSPRGRRRHQGVDLRGLPGQPVLAARSGRVVYSGSTMRGYGKTVILDHGEGLRSLYAHNSALLVRKGERVRGGQPIARIGRSGNATAFHCHFEIHRDRRPVDPLPFLGGPRR